ncbi:MAG: hypothetical protein MUF38_05090 [Anaerolineae bacterium]|jgi:hypothetical protein|nr:hypothetical protein [Anaerolineae bacterium]
MKSRHLTQKIPKLGIFCVRLYVTPTGITDAALPNLSAAIFRLLEILYSDEPQPLNPISNKHLSNAERNGQICARHAAGDTLEEIAKDFNLSLQRVHQIIHRWCKPMTP